MTIQTIQHLRNEVKKLGMSWSKMSPFLPDWWQDVSDHPAGIVELRGFIAKYFGLDIDRSQGNLCLHNQSSTCFKTRAGTDQNKLAPNQSVLTSIARQVALATSKPWKGTMPSATELRNAILSTGRPWVGFQELVEWCWLHGIPVICLPDLPFPHKMQGLVTFCLGRPVIALSKKPDKPGWALFILAHEMGHLALEHLTREEGSALLDEQVSENDDGNSDLQEHHADQYAVALLTGSTTRFNIPSYVTAESLARDADSKGKEMKIDPAHLALNAIHHTQSTSGENLYRLIPTILDYLNPEKQTASSICRQALRQHVELARLPEESVAFLERFRLIE